VKQPNLPQYQPSDPILLRFCGESNPKINESLATCLDLGIFG